MKPGIPEIGLAAAAALFGVSVAFAQTAAPPPPPSFANPPHKNLKVLPQDISGPELIGAMKFFAMSLGVRCSFCHVGEEGKPLSTYDFASDAKKEKQTARRMIAMADRINKEDFGVTEVSKHKVTCFTCHRGSPHPATIPPQLQAPPSPGAAAPPKPERGAA
jgi:hypothetical protein